MALFETQRELDEKIQQNHNLQHENLVTRKILAFQVELGELANETRCFKFWSLKPPSAHSVIIEEFVDGLHFLLSLGLEIDGRFETLQPGEKMHDLCDQFQLVYRLAAQFDMFTDTDHYKELFSAFLELGHQLGMTDKEITDAYLMKNQVNHERQQQGY
jgi:dimeric dUTPase (all-alpha-NTP-PPase superfamily)